MSDLISRDFIQKCRGVVLTQEVIDAMPTVDAVEVVRCKDCKHCDEECCPDGLRWCSYLQKAMIDYEYCSHGERKEVTHEET